MPTPEQVCTCSHLTVWARNKSTMKLLIVLASRDSPVSEVRRSIMSVPDFKWTLTWPLYRNQVNCTFSSVLMLGLLLWFYCVLLNLKYIENRILRLAAPRQVPWRQMFTGPPCANGWCWSDQSFMAFHSRHHCDSRKEWCNSCQVHLCVGGRLLK